MSSVTTSDGPQHDLGVELAAIGRIRAHADTWVPGLSQEFITTGVAELVAATTMSALDTASSADAAARTGTPISWPSSAQNVSSRAAIARRDRKLVEPCRRP